MLFLDIFGVLICLFDIITPGSEVSIQLINHLDLNNLNFLISKVCKIAIKYENKYKTDEIPIKVFVKKLHLRYEDLYLLFNEMEMHYYNAIGIVSCKKLISVATRMRLENKNQKLINRHSMFQSILIALILPLAVSIIVNFIANDRTSQCTNNCNCNSKNNYSNIK